MKTIYVCDKCGQEFRSKALCFIHERQCIDGMDSKKAALMWEESEFNPNGNSYGQVVCNHCNNHYMVYGCELDCDYSKVCGRVNNYKYFNKQDKKASKYFRENS